MRSHHGGWRASLVPLVHGTATRGHHSSGGGTEEAPQWWRELHRKTKEGRYGMQKKPRKKTASS